MRARLAFALALGLTTTACGGEDGLGPGAPYAIRVVSFEEGLAGGFGAERLPDVVLGGPRGAGEWAGSTDVLSLGIGGSITLELGLEVVDGPGPDLILFENAFRPVGSDGIYAEPAVVSVSLDGQDFVELPCDPVTPPFDGCAGLQPVYANVDDGGPDPLDPAVSGGDALDLAAAGIARARFVRIVDSGVDHSSGPMKGGFDLDAIAVLHAP